MVESVRSSKPSYSLDEFVNIDTDNAGLGGLYPVPLYVRCFRALGVKTRGELDELCKRRYA